VLFWTLEQRKVEAGTRLIVIRGSRLTDFDAANTQAPWR